MNSPLAQQLSSNLKENAQYQIGSLPKSNLLLSPQFSSSSATQNSSTNHSNSRHSILNFILLFLFHRKNQISNGNSQSVVQKPKGISSLAGLKSIVNPTANTMQNPVIRKGSIGTNNFEPKSTNMNFSQGYITNSHSLQQQQSSLTQSQQQSHQLSNHQRSFSNSKLLQQKYVSSSIKNNSTQNQTNMNTNISNSDYQYASNYSSVNANNPNPISGHQNQTTVNNNQSVNHQSSTVTSSSNPQSNHFMSMNVYNISNNNSENGQVQNNQQGQGSVGFGVKSTSPPKSSLPQNSANNAAFNLFKHSYLKTNSNNQNTANQGNATSASISAQNNMPSSGASTNTNSILNSTSQKSLQQTNSNQQQLGLQQQQQQHQTGSNSNTTGINTMGKSSINLKQRQNISNPSQTPKQTSPLSSHQGQLSSYQSIDKLSHLQSIEKIKEDINKKLLVQQHLNAQLGSSNQNSNGSKSSTPQGLSNKLSSSNSEHKNNSTAATNNILLSINNQSTSVSRKMSNGAGHGSSNINSFINSSSNANHNQLLINSSSSKSPNLQSTLSNTMVASGGNTNLSSLNNKGINEIVSLNATSTNLPQNSQSNLQYSNYVTGQNNNSFTNMKGGGGEDNSSTNIIFEKVKKRKLNNLSIGNQQSPHTSSSSQPQSHLSSQKNLQYIIQNKSPNTHTSTASHGSNQKGLSKTMSFSGHQNNFYSTNCYIKSPQLNHNNSGNQTHLQSLAGSMNQSMKSKNKKMNSNHDIQSHIAQAILSNSQQQQQASAINNHTNISTIPHSNYGSTYASNHQGQKNNSSLEGPGSTSGNTTNHARNSSSQNLSPKLNKENLFMESQLNQIQSGATGIGNLNTLNGTQLLLKDPKIFFKNPTTYHTNSSGKGLLQQMNSQNTTPTHSNQITYPTLNAQSSSYNQKFSDTMTRQSNPPSSTPQQQAQQYPPPNQSLNSSYVQANSQLNLNQPQGSAPAPLHGQSGLNGSFWQQQISNNKIILNKLENLDLENNSNPIDHISEIASLLLISLQETPLSEAVKKFEENISKINQENKQKQKQVQHKLTQKIREVEILQKDLNVVQIKLSQKENEMVKNASTGGGGYNKKKADQQTQTSAKKKPPQNNKNSVIQICDQNGNVQEVDTDKENEMLKDYILEQEKKVNQFKEKEAKMIKLLLAIKKRGIDIDDIYNNDVINEDSNDEILKNNPIANGFPIKKKKNPIDTEFFKKLDNEFQYADNSIVNDSDESSFGYYGKPSDRDTSQSVKTKQQKKVKYPPAKLPSKIPKKLQEKFKENLENIKKQESEDDDEEENNNKFHQNILNNLQITQEQLDELQEQIQKDPNNLSPEQIQLIQQIHQLQQQQEQQQQQQQQGTAQQQFNQQQQLNIQDLNPQQTNAHNIEQILHFDEDSSINESQLDGMQSNILPSDLKKQLTTISKQSEDDIQVVDDQNIDIDDEFTKYFVNKQY